MATITVRSARLEDVEHYPELIMLSAPGYLPYIFGSGARDLLSILFPDTGNWFSFEHSHCAEVDGEVAGMALAYSYSQKKAEESRTLELTVRHLKSSFVELPDPRIIELAGQIEEGDYYISDMGMYPKFRGLGCGTRLFERLEDEARKAGCGRVVLDVKTDNTKARALYERLGYRIETRSPVLKTYIQDFEFFKMAKATR